MPSLPTSRLHRAHLLSVALIATFTALLIAGPAMAADQAIPGEAIVTFDPGTSSADRADAREEADTTFEETAVLPRTQLVSFDGSVDSAVRRLERQGAVTDAQPNYVYSALATAPTDDYFGELWGLRNTGQRMDDYDGVFRAGTPGVDVGALRAWDTTRGGGTIVAVVDSGVDAGASDLFDRIWTNPNESANGRDDDGDGFVDDLHGADFVDNDNDPDDPEGHGSHVAGTAVATANNGGVVGVAPEAQLMPVRVLDASGHGTTLSVANGISYASSHGADSINLSLSGPSGSGDAAVLTAVKTAGNNGSVVVAAAGNSSSNNDAVAVTPCNLTPANLICVASIRNDGTLSSFSNYGRKSVDLAAPGEQILSVDSHSGGGYVYMDGTSMASPQVSGAAALLASADPTATPAQIVTALRTSTHSLSSLSGKTASGGTLDAAHALGVLLGAAEPTPTPTGGSTVTSPPTTPVAPAPAPVAPARTYVAPKVTTSAPRAPSRAATPVKKRAGCAGLHGRKLAHCRVELSVKRKCSRYHGAKKRLCAKRVRAVARCTTLSSKSRRAKKRKHACLVKARAIGKRRHTKHS